MPPPHRLLPSRLWAPSQPPQRRHLHRTELVVRNRGGWSPPSAAVEWVRRMTSGGRAIAIRRQQEIESRRDELGTAPKLPKREGRQESRSRVPAPPTSCPLPPSRQPPPPPAPPRGFSPSTLPPPLSRPAFFEAAPRARPPWSGEQPRSHGHGCAHARCEPAAAPRAGVAPRQTCPADDDGAGVLARVPPVNSRPAVQPRADPGHGAIILHPQIRQGAREACSRPARRPRPPPPLPAVPLFFLQLSPPSLLPLPEPVPVKRHDP